MTDEQEPEVEQLFIKVEQKGHPTEGNSITLSLPGASMVINWTDPDHANVLMAKWEEILDHLLTEAHVNEEVDSDTE